MQKNVQMLVVLMLMDWRWRCIVQLIIENKADLNHWKKNVLGGFKTKVAAHYANDGIAQSRRCLMAYL